MHFSLRFSSTGEIKLIISVSKKVAKHAVVRNKVKRRVRAVFKNLAENLKPGTYLIIAKPGAEEIKGEVLRDELATLFKKI